MEKRDVFKEQLKLYKEELAELHIMLVKNSRYTDVESVITRIKILNESIEQLYQSALHSMVEEWLSK